MGSGRAHQAQCGALLLTIVAVALQVGYHKVDRRPLDEAAKYLLRMQCRNGDFPQQQISGVFNRNCMITYANYRWVSKSNCMITYANYRQAARRKFVRANAKLWIMKDRSHRNQEHARRCGCRNIFPLWALGKYRTEVLGEGKANGH